MNLAKIILLIGGFFVFTKASQYFSIMKSLLNLRLQKADGEIKQLNELPEYLETLLPSYDIKLQNLGFSVSHLHLLNTCSVSNFSKQWNMVYFNKDNNCYASVIISLLPEKYEPLKVEFDNIFHDKTRLITQNGTECDVIGEIPNVIFNDPCVPTLEQQYMAHIKKLKSLNRESIKLSAQDYLASEIQTNNNYIISLEQKDYLKSQDGTIWQLRLLPAMKHTIKTLRGIKKIKNLRAAQLKASGAKKLEQIEIPIEAEVNAYLNLEDVLKRPSSGIGWKLMVFFITLTIGIAICLQCSANTFASPWFVSWILVHLLSSGLASIWSSNSPASPSLVVVKIIQQCSGILSRSPSRRLIMVLRSPCASLTM